MIMGKGLSDEIGIKPVMDRIIRLDRMVRIC